MTPALGSETQMLMIDKTAPAWNKDRKKAQYSPPSPFA